jgi:3-methyladenine DNA glycosylase AlkD
VIVRWLRPHVVPERRAFLHAGYAPTRLRWIGVPVPAMRQVARNVERRMRGAPAREVVALAHALTGTGLIEARQVGFELIGRRKDAIASLTPVQIERLGRGLDNWAAVDGFASAVTGPAWLAGRIADADVRRWARSPNPWWRRTALSTTVSRHVHARADEDDARRTLMIGRMFARETDPMLARALSWALRTAAARDPLPVRTFLRAHADTLPALVAREVSVKLATGRKAPRRAGPGRRA